MVLPPAGKPVFQTKTVMANKPRAFTLIELLVVIAIIALLMSILMPTLTKVRQQAKGVIGQSNQKQWGLYFSIYTGDNNGYFHGGPGTSPDSMRWLNVLRPYYGDNNDIRLCPMATKPIVEDGEVVRRISSFVAWGIFDTTSDYRKCGDYGSTV